MSQCAPEAMQIKDTDRKLLEVQNYQISIIQLFFYNSHLDIAIHIRIHFYVIRTACSHHHAYMKTASLQSSTESSKTLQATSISQCSGLDRTLSSWHAHLQFIYLTYSVATFEEQSSYIRALKTTCQIIQFLNKIYGEAQQYEIGTLIQLRHPIQIRVKSSRGHAVYAR